MNQEEKCLVCLTLGLCNLYKTYWWLYVKEQFPISYKAIAEQWLCYLDNTLFDLTVSCTHTVINTELK